jgi:hypothetical protein
MEWYGQEGKRKKAAQELGTVCRKLSPVWGKLCLHQLHSSSVDCSIPSILTVVTNTSSWTVSKDFIAI